MVEVFGVSNCSVGVDSCCRNCFRYRSSSGRGGVTNVGCEENSLGSFDASLSTNDLSGVGGVVGAEVMLRRLL